ncbi:MAG TPA: hypothetical protein VMU10_01840 [Desulfomonilia bacterium]|nr:hypothetical protein [Desulfomonilia bacterium]
MLARLLTTYDHDFIDSISGNDLPALIACIWKDKEFIENVNKVESVARYFHGEMNTYYALEDMYPYFRNKYGITGTPTYLILYKGDVLGTILGKISIQSLIDHVTTSFLTHVKDFKSRNKEKDVFEGQTAELRTTGDDNKKKKTWEPG